MKKLLVVAVLLGGVAVSFAYATNSNSTEVEGKLPRCLAKFYSCPNGGFAQKCTRKGGVETPFCDQAGSTGCYVIQNCK